MSERQRSGDGGGDPAPREAAMLRRLIEEAGFLFSLRDGEGVLIGGDRSGLGDAPDAEPSTPSGASFLGYRFLDPNGRELPLLRHPAHVARTTGVAQRNVLLGVLGRTGSERWLQYSYLPRERRAGGWSVLSFGADVTPLVERQRAAEQRAEHAEALFALAAGLVAAADIDAIATAVGAFGLHALPEAMLTMTLLWQPRELRCWTARNPSGLEPAPNHLPLTGGTLARWERMETHVNLQIGDAEVYGARVVGGSVVPMRSLVMAPLVDGARRRTGNFAAASPTPGAFNAAQIQLVERAADLVARTLERVRPLTTDACGCLSLAGT